MGFTYCGYVLSDYDLILIHSSLPVYLNILCISFTSCLGAETQETNNNKESKKRQFVILHLFLGLRLGYKQKSILIRYASLQKIYFV